MSETTPGLLKRIGCALSGHPRKRIRYWQVKPDANGPYTSGWTGGPLGIRREAAEGPPFAVVDFQCPDCNRNWFTELS